MLTVTYDTACASYLSTKTLQQVALDGKRDFPLVSKIVLKDLYMDDCLSGSSDINGFEMLQSELTPPWKGRNDFTQTVCANKAQPTEPHVYSFDRNVGGNRSII